MTTFRISLAPIDLDLSDLPILGIISFRLYTLPKNTSITLGDHFGAFISEQTRTGRYGSSSEVVRAGSRLLEDTEARIRALRQALIEGEESGFIEYNYDSFVASLDAGD